MDACSPPSAISDLFWWRRLIGTNSIESSSCTPDHLHMHRSRNFDYDLVSVLSFALRNRGVDLTTLVSS